MPAWFDKVFKSGAGKPKAVSGRHLRTSELPAAATAAPQPAPAPEPAYEDEGRPKVRRIIDAPILVAEEEQSSWSEEVRIKARVARDGMSCVFLVDRPVLDGLSAWLPDAQWAEDVSPLAVKLFAIEGVGSVLLHNTTITITPKATNDRPWEDLAKEIGSVIREHLKSDEPVVTEKFRESVPSEQEVRDRVKACIDLEINPGIASHGGVVTLERVDGNTIYITMGGGCQGCAASAITLRQGIHQSFRRAVPAVGAIYDETDHSAGTNPFFKELPAGMA